MTKTVEFWFDFGSPTAYLAWRQLPKIAEARGAVIDYRPMLLGGVHKATGNNPPGAVPAKGAYMGRDLQRFAKRYGVELNFNPDFPINTLVLMRGAVAAQGEGDAFFHKYLATIFEAMWLKPRNLNGPMAKGVGCQVSPSRPTTGGTPARTGAFMTPMPHR